MIARCFLRKGFARFFRLLIFSLAFLNPSVVFGNGCAGDLDPTFTDGVSGGDGRRRYDWGDSQDIAKDVAIQCDGKIVVVGRSGPSTNEGDFVVMRLSQDGSLDTTFNSTGIQKFDFGGSDDQARRVLIQCDGKIVVVGDSDNVIALARLNPDGSFDTTFDADGKTVITGTQKGWGAAIQCDGKIVVVGDKWVVRLNPDGSLDPTFNGDGKKNVNFGGGAADLATSVAIQCDGKIVVAGHVNGDFAVNRLNPDGSDDTTFNANGRVVFPVLGTEFDLLNDAVVQCDGKIVLVGAAGFSNFALARLNPDGSLDPTFDGTGKKTIGGSGAPNLQKVTIQCDGRIVAAGIGSFSGNSEAVVFRLDPDGSLDQTFGDVDGTDAMPGMKRIEWSTTTQIDSGFGVAIQCDGKIVVVGTTEGIGNFAAIARLLPGCLPIANNKSITTRQNKPVVALDSSDIGSTFSAGDNQVIDMSSLQITQDPTNGIVLVNPTTGTVIYLPGTGFVGTDTFKYTVKDARVCCCCCPCGPCPPCFTDGTEVVGTECLVPCDRAFVCSSPLACDPCKHCSDCALESEEGTVTITVESPPIIVSYPGYRPN